MSGLTPEERRILGKVAAHESWAKTEDRTARTRPARDAMMRRFLDEAGGDAEKAEHLRKAYFARLAFKSSVARRRAREAREEAESAERELSALGAEDQEGLPRQ